MRRTVVIGLSLLVSVATAGGVRVLLRQDHYRRVAAAAATKAVGATAPVPQDAAAIEKRRHEWLAWNRRTLQGAYDEVGKRNARWDEPARKTMELAARMFSGEVDPEVTLSEVYASAKAAVHAGCNDPMLLYLYSRSSVGPNDPGMPEAIRRAKESAKALAASRYPAIRRAVALQVSGDQALSAGDPGDGARKDAERDFDAALALLGESVASDEHNEFWEANWLDTLLGLTRGYRTLGVSAEAAYGRVDAGLSRVADAKVLRLVFRGIFWFHYGWEARTTAFAPAVPAGGFEALEERLAVAQDGIGPGLAAPARPRCGGPISHGYRQGDRRRPCHDGTLVRSGHESQWRRSGGLLDKARLARSQVARLGRGNARLRTRLPRHEELADRNHPPGRRRPLARSPASSVGRSRPSTWLARGLGGYPAGL